MHQWQRRYWQKRSPLLNVVGMAIAFWLFCVALLLWRYYGFYPSYATFDQGIFNQVFWNSLRGQWFQSSLSSTESIAVVRDRALPDVTYQRLGQHFTPALLLWLPFYALFQSPAGLSILQVTLVTAAGLLLYALARHRLSEQLAVWITASYYAANAVIAPTLANFHDFSQIPLYCFGLLLAFEKRKWWVFWLLCGLTLLVREDAGIILFGIGFYFALSRQSIRIGLILCTLSLSYILLLTNVVMPLFSPDISRRFMVEQFGQFVEGQEASTLQVILGMLSQPWLLVWELLNPIGPTFRYLLAQGLPLAFVPFISPSSWALASFPLLQILIRQDPSALMIDRRYAITLVPGLFYGTILWWSCHRDRLTQRFWRFWLSCLLVGLLLTFTANPNRALSFILPDSFQPWVYTSPVRQWQHAQVIRSLLSQIPADASISATSFIVPHISGRREALRFPQVRLRNDQSQVIQIEYAIADLWQFQQYQSVYPWEREQLQRSTQALTRMVEGNKYGLLVFQDGVALLRRDAVSQPQALQAWRNWQSKSL
jgi:uncharacterized membrane protein